MQQREKRHMLSANGEANDTPALTDALGSNAAMKPKKRKQLALTDAPKAQCFFDLCWQLLTQLDLICHFE